MAAPPDHLVSAFPDNTATGQEQYELIGNVESRDVKLNAVVGNVDYDAVVRENTNSHLNLRNAVEAVAWRLASLTYGWVHNGTAPSLAASTPLNELHSRTAIVRRLKGAPEFSLHLPAIWRLPVTAILDNPGRREVA
jgi:hypothetical protein